MFVSGRTLALHVHIFKWSDKQASLIIGQVKALEMLDIGSIFFYLFTARGHFKTEYRV